MKLNSKRIDFEYTPGEEIFTFPEDTGLPFFFDVDEELTDNPSAMDAVGEMLDEAETLAERAKAAIKAALADESSPYHDLVTFIEMVDLLRLKRFGSLVDGETGQQAFILDLSFNPEITDELMVVYFDLNKEIFYITHER